MDEIPITLVLEDMQDLGIVPRLNGWWVYMEPNHEL